MYIKDISSKVLNDEFDRIFELINDPKMFSRFRKFIESRGLIYKSFMNRLFNIRLFNKFSKKITPFGLLVVENTDIDIDILINGVENDTESIDPLNVLLNFEDRIQYPDQRMSKQFIELIRVSFKDFSEKEKSTELAQKKFGSSVNETLISLGATIVEQDAYWKNIKEKRLLSPHSFMVYLKLLDKKSLKIGDITTLLAKYGEKSENVDYSLPYLPENVEIAKGILKSYLESRRW